MPTTSKRGRFAPPSTTAAKRYAIFNVLAVHSNGTTTSTQVDSANGEFEPAKKAALEWVIRESENPVVRVFIFNNGKRELREYDIRAGQLNRVFAL